MTLKHAKGSNSQTSNGNFQSLNIERLQKKVTSPTIKTNIPIHKLH